MLKRILIMIMLIPLAACGDGLNSTRAAAPDDLVLEGDSISDICAPYIDALNRAVPGNTSADMLEIVEHYAEIDGPARYHVLIGVNDIIKGIEDGYAARLNAILGLLEGEVIVTSILPTRMPGVNDKVLALNETARALAEHWGHTFRDMHDDFKVHEGIADPDGLLHIMLTTDGLHLNEKGCLKLFEGL